MEQLINLVYSVDDYLPYIKEFIELIDIIKNYDGVKYYGSFNNGVCFYDIVSPDFIIYLNYYNSYMNFKLCKDNILVYYCSAILRKEKCLEFYKLTDEQINVLFKQRDYRLDLVNYQKIPKPERCIKVKSAIF